MMLSFPLLVICSCASTRPSENQIKEVQSLDEIQTCKKIGMVNGRSSLGILYFNTSISNAKIDALEKAHEKKATHLYFTQVNPPTMQGGAWVTGDAYNCLDKITTPPKLAPDAAVIQLSKQSERSAVPNNSDYVAILELEGKSVDAGIASTITDILTNKMQALGCYRIMERNQVDKILQEQGFQNSGACSASECAVEMGRLLSIKKMVVGSVGKLGNSYVINLRMIDVKTGEITSNSSRQIVGGIENSASAAAEMATDLCNK